MRARVCGRVLLALAKARHQILATYPRRTGCTMGVFVCVSVCVCVVDVIVRVLNLPRRVTVSRGTSFGGVAAWEWHQKLHLIIRP